MLVWVMPVLAAACALVSDDFEAAAYAALLFDGVFFLSWVPLTIMAVARHRDIWRPLASLALGLGASWISTRAIYGVPRWVQERARPAIAAFETYRRDHGEYPPDNFDDPRHFDFWKTIKPTGCTSWHVLDGGASYQLGCRGVLFTHCLYHSKTRTWTSFN